MKHRGLFVAIEGTEGVDRDQQFQLLARRLRDNGYEVVLFDFPQYGQPSSYFVREYLRGAYGNPADVNAHTASLFYALDRYEASHRIQEALSTGKVVLANRFTASSRTHQGAKIETAESRREYFEWLEKLEHELLDIPQPDKTFVLRVRAKQQDDQKILEVYDDLFQLFPQNFTRIDCVRSGQLMTADTIHEHLWKRLEPQLPQRKAQTKTKSAETTTMKSTQMSTDLVTKEGHAHAITPAGKSFLSDAVTSVDDPVYAFYDKFSPVTIAAAMARLSRRSDDLRVTLLDEFVGSEDKDEELLHRVITAYGDDSVQQLVGVHMVVENASNLLTKKLEWGRLGAYLEQSTRYVYFDQKDMYGQYKYFTPNHLDQKTKATYQADMDNIFDLYSEIVRKLVHYIRSTSKLPVTKRDTAWHNATRAQACDAVRPLLPVATKSSVGMFLSGQAIESLVMHLMSDELPEAQKTGRQILEHARKIIPSFLERADKPERGGATIAYRANTGQAVKDLAHKYLPDNHSNTSEAVQLVSVFPRNELDLIPDMLYEHSNLSRNEIARAVSEWPIQRKQQTFQAYIGERLNRRHRPGRALEKAHYSWDILCDYGIFRDLQRHRMVDDLAWQELTPRYGYEIPELIEEAGLIDQFEECFQISLRLHSALQSAGYPLEAQYATLLGHKMRWKVTYNAREAFHIHELRTSPQGHPTYRKLVQQMHEKLAEIHPMLAEAMKFVNQSEDPELTRLAAERYAQYKQRSL
jgi:thymidylate synthase ThyX/thymidylate kinase